MRIQWILILGELVKFQICVAVLGRAVRISISISMRMQPKKIFMHAPWDEFKIKIRHKLSGLLFNFLSRGNLNQGNLEGRNELIK